MKTTYRRAENLLGRAENTDVVISAAVGRPARDLTTEWNGVLFNSFHDILPGSCIERAAEDQTAWLGSVIHASQQAELSALNALAEVVDTRVTVPPEDHPSAVAALVWNPHPFPFQGQVELEAALDYRPIWEFTNRPQELPIQVNGASREPIPFQEIRTEHSSLVDLAWRKRVVVPVNLPAFGWNVLEFGWRRDAKNPAIKNPVKSGADWIDNGRYRVQARVGASGPAISHRGKSLFGKSGLSAAVFEDPWGSWGGMIEEPDAIRLETVRERWKVTNVEVLERGPQRATLWVRLAGKRSRLDLSISLSHEREAVDVQARVFWDERSARLKLILPVGDQAEFEVPGGSVKRGPAGQVPGIGWVRVGSKKAGFGFTSDAFYDFDTQAGEFRPTVVRATRYANDVNTPADAELWRPAVDSGELKLRFVLAPGSADLPALSRELQQPPVVLLVPPKKGPLRRSGSLAELTPASLKLVAVKRAETGKGVVVRVQASAGPPVTAKLAWLGKKMTLGRVRGGELASWLLSPAKSGWETARVLLTEDPAVEDKR
ncbi:MAG: glycoside hydrolase family 38 C-terminal domain-containing protein, partial [Verrucomicrobiota bacterium]